MTSGAGKAPRRASVDAARLAAYDVLVAVRQDDAYANLVAAAAPARAPDRGPRRRLRDRAGRRHPPGPGHVRRCHRPSRRSATRPVRPRRPAPRRPSAPRDAGARPRGCDQHRRAGAHASGSQAGRLHQRRDCAGSPSGTSSRGWTCSMRRRAVRFSHPQWIVDDLARALGRPDELEALLAADNARPRVTLVARPGLSTVAELAEGPDDSTISPLGVTLESGDPGAIPAVRDGRAGVQDAGSQLVALALARATVDGRGRALARPVCRSGREGGPARSAGHRTGRPAAGQRAPAAPRKAGRAVPCERPWVTSSSVTAPGRRGQRARFDRVLVDAPCTGLGALRRRPESRWRRTRDDLGALVPLQQALLRSALDSVRPGGVVLYATCSPVVEETAGVVGPVLADRPDARLEDIVVAGSGGDRRGVGPPRGRRAAVAAPPRHRRDVHGAAAAG